MKRLTIAVAVGVIAAPAFSQNAARGGGPNPEAIAAARALPTPRMPDGKPDLTGFWSTRAAFGAGQNVVSEDGKKIEFQIAPSFADSRAARAGGGGRAGGAAAPPPGGGEPNPTYKPQLLAKVDRLAKTDVDNDPSFVCNPNGTPRAGAPGEIFQSKDAVALLYDSRNDYRVIPTHAGARHDPQRDPSWYGDSIGRWEGDTLVVDTVNITDESWLAGAGRFHSDQLKVTERFTREGNTLRYEVRVEDPVVLVKPWVMVPRTILLGKSGDHLVEDEPCHERDQKHMVDKFHITP